MNKTLDIHQIIFVH